MPRTLKFDEQPPLLSPNAVVSRLASIWTVLPQSYRDFIIATNGGMPSDENVFLRIADRCPGGNTSIQYFFSVENEKFPTLELLVNKGDYSYALPPWMLPIASDQFGNVFALSLRGDGRFYFWVHDNDSPDQTYPAFESFEAFLEALGPEPEE